MDLLDKAEHWGKKLKYEYKGNQYSQAAARLERYSSTIQKDIEFCQEKLQEINPDLSESSGDVITDFEEGINKYKQDIYYIIQDAINEKKSIDTVAKQAYKVAEKYYRMARREKRKCEED